MKIKVNSGVTAKLIAGPADSDALARLGIAPGTLSSASTTSSSSTSSSSTSSSSTQTFGLGLSTNMDISTATDAGAARAQLLNVLSAIQSAYQTSNTPASSTSKTTQSSGTASPYLQSQIANYTLALNLMSASSSNTTSTSSSTTDPILSIIS